MVGVVVGSGLQSSASAGSPTLVGPVVGGVGALAAEADLRSRRVPDRLIVIGLVAAVTVAVVAEVVAGTGSPSRSMAIGALTTSLPLLIVHVVAPAQVGFGDVKLSALIGALLGVISWSLGGLALFSGMVLALVGVVFRWWPSRSIPFAACLAMTAVGCLAIARWVP